MPRLNCGFGRVYAKLKSDFILCQSGPGSLLSSVIYCMPRILFTWYFFLSNFNLNTVMHLQVMWEMQLWGRHRGLWWEKDWLMHFEIGYYCQCKMQALPKSIETVQGCKKVVEHIFVFPVLQLPAMLLSGRSSVMCAGCHTCVLSSGHTGSGCIFSHMWVAREEGSPSLPVILMMTLWNTSHEALGLISLLFFTCFHHF